MGDTLYLPETLTYRPKTVVRHLLLLVNSLPFEGYVIQKPPL